MENLTTVPDETLRGMIRDLDPGDSLELADAIARYCRTSPGTAALILKRACEGWTLSLEVVRSTLKAEAPDESE